ncbi:DUF485 domain-containing protein [Rhodococcus pseudokoreensis]|uniref:DUF485 domain-containing protein n=1 Tax=Rhodococcus pseudokoreensis TaxID=2811421 RepID=A0A974ZTJ9_9NOCA|nr:DUF485 domain-containing protein [Rhodococcus pseudokoreensis]QSE89841.1 DUF485 domain-containing protein [Rhodococcus pseudokoreensis]
MPFTETAVDWSRLWSDPAMLRLRDDRRSFFTIAWSVFAVAFFALVGFAAFAPEIIAKRPVPGLSIGLILALTYVATVMSLGAWYVRRARHWDTLAAAVLSTPTTTREREVTGNV